VSETISAFTLRSVAVTDYGWIAYTATTMEDDSDTAHRLARSENNRALHEQLQNEPPGVGMGFAVRSTWRIPSDDTRIKIAETVVHQDLLTGKTLNEREVEGYEITYPALIGE
jgi:hypothetical protein